MAQVTARRSFPLWAHAILLAAVLMGMAWVVAPPRTPFVSDEGAYILEAKLIGDSGRFTVPVGPTVPNAPAQYVGSGGAFFTGHPAYPLALAGAKKLLGEHGYVMLSVFGAVLAALLSAHGSRLIEPGLDAAVLWVVGIASPLFFDSFITIAHTLGAAAAAAAWISAVMLGLRARTSRSVGWGAALVAAVAAGVVLRSEGLIVAGALILGSLVMAWTDRSKARRWLNVAALTGVTTIAVRLAEARWIASLFHGRAALPASIEGRAGGAVAFARGQAGALAHNVLWPAPFSPPLRSFVLLGGAASMLVMGLYTRRAGGERAVLVAGLASCLCYGVWLARGTPSPVAGFIVAWPVALTGIACLRWSDVWSNPAARMTAITAAGLVVGVGALGTDAVFQWGGRYLSAVIPLLAPLVVLGVKRLAPSVRGAVVGMSCFVSILIFALAINCLNAQHVINDGVRRGIAQCARVAGPSGLPGADGRTVVVVSASTIPQIAWSRYADYTWQNAEQTTVSGTLERLSTDGVHSLVVASTRRLRQSDIRGYHVVSTCSAGWAMTFALRVNGSRGGIS